MADIMNYGMSQKRYTKLIKRNLKLITPINNMYLFLASFVGIYLVLREIWPSEHEIYTKNFGQL